MLLDNVSRSQQQHVVEVMWLSMAMWFQLAGLTQTAKERQQLHRMSPLSS
jgi:hypothetical protein